MHLWTDLIDFQPFVFKLATGKQQNHVSLVPTAIPARIVCMKVASARNTRSWISARHGRSDLVGERLNGPRPIPRPSRVVFMSRLLHDREVL